MKQVTTDELQARCLAILSEMDAEGVVVVRDGKPVARLVPVGSASSRWIGGLKDELKIEGDVSSTGREWDADRGRWEPSES